LNELDLILNVLLLTEHIATIYLELINCDACDFRSSESGDVASWSTNPATAVKDFGASADCEASSEVVLMAEDRSIKGLSLAAIGKVE